jgi:predicted RecA/RadA family phage recombinase
MGSRKVSDGQSVRVTVPASTTVEQHSFAQVGGVLGFAIQRVVTGAGETKPLVLAIERCEYETDQIDTADAFAVGEKVYWDNTNRRFTTVAADGRYAGFVTSAKSADSIWFVFEPSTTVA